MSFSFKYYFTGPENQFVAEIELLNMPQNATKAEIYQWVYYDGSTLHKLTYQNSENYVICDVRIFEEGTFIFDSEKGILNCTMSKECIAFDYQEPEFISQENKNTIQKILF